jgi:hypothetical protein
VWGDLIEVSRKFLGKLFHDRKSSRAAHLFADCEEKEVGE